MLYVADLACYDQKLFEDESVNAMHESINLFHELCNCRWLKRSAMVLFLNKQDLFQEKVEIKKRSLKVCFPLYDGQENDYNEGIPLAYVGDCILW